MFTIIAFTVANWLIILLCLSDTKKIKLIIYFIKSFQKHFLNIFSQIQCADKYKDISASMYVHTTRKYFRWRKENNCSIWEGEVAGLESLTYLYHWQTDLVSYPLVGPQYAPEPHWDGQHQQWDHFVCLSQSHEHHSKTHAGILSWHCQVEMFYTFLFRIFLYILK